MNERDQCNTVAMTDEACDEACDAELRGIGWAVKQLYRGKRLTRKRWGGRAWLELQVDDPGSKMQVPYIYVGGPATLGMGPWVAAQEDLLAADWQIVCGECGAHG